ncbi:cytochrome d ubiquinol oxidase subunit II [Photobacterium galatheae]|uniref:Ubiquinol oxidase subunit II n=1 Tax=Photobacterium galatheae TaxID=1654360 RepID=A0A066RT35_9GAMM|nr:cytochrome d ubiquinol oxidase subunit II [Photobacterium galatheae]KDM90548.1 ubiquinol oxidase subunit II [Photobacterium galatheae]MCM0148072.1 cytochrome d ubiquinol oxidase subunit II [Photobacterium galatheae]
MGVDLSVLWFGIIVFATLMYITMDGFDLGIGILMPMVKDSQQKDLMVNTVAPVWDGNETWLVLGGASLFGAFPLAYAVIIDALTIPLTIMLIALIFRGVAFEFRFKALPSHLGFWDKAFMVGSIVATFSQGVVVGAVIEGFPVTARHFAGGPFDWLTPFALFCGLGLVVAYALLGSSWLIMKTEGALQALMYRVTPKILWLLLVIIAVVSVWTALAQEAISARWFSLPNLIYFAPVPLLTVFLAKAVLLSVQKQKERLPFVMSLGIVFLGFSGLGISLWPNIIPPDISIWEASAPPQSQGFMLVGALFIIPFILGYTFWSYSVFSGKVSAEESYH